MAKSEVKWIRLGEFLHQRDQRNTEGLYGESSVVGLSTSKSMIKTKANLNGVNLASYKIFPPENFAYVTDTSRRGDKVSLAMNNTRETFLVSSISVVFETTNGLLPEYLFLWFNRSEFDRYARFHSCGSAREAFDYEDMCDVQIPVPYTDGKPDLEKQKVVVDSWQGLRKMKEDNEQLVEPLMQLCRSYMESVKKKYNPTHIGPFIEEIDERNTDGKFKEDSVVGLATSKEIIKTKANLEGVNLTSYKVFRPNDIAYVADTSRRGDKVSLAMNKTDETYLVSSITTVFRTKKGLLPGFLYLWFRRPEFDRYARFHSWGSAREAFDYDKMEAVKIPIPSEQEQQAIIDIYLCAERAKHIAEEADRLSREICPALMQHIIHEN